MTTTAVEIPTLAKSKASSPARPSRLPPNENDQQEGSSSSQIYISLTESFESTEASILPADAEVFGAAASSLLAHAVTPLSPVGESPPPRRPNNNNNAGTPPRNKRVFFARSPASTPTRPGTDSSSSSSLGGESRTPPRNFRLRPKFKSLGLGKDRSSPPPQEPQPVPPEPSPHQEEPNAEEPAVAGCSSNGDNAAETNSTGTSTTIEASSLDRDDDGPNGDGGGDNTNNPSSWSTPNGSTEEELPSTEDDDNDCGGEAQQPSEDEEGEKPSPSTLFRDEMDIVAFQEWPLRHRQRTPAVETIATRLGRSPVRVTFRQETEAWPDPSDDDYNDLVDLEHPIALQARIPTGLPPMMPPPTDDRRRRNSGNNNGCSVGSCSPAAETILNAIESTLQSMMCVD